MGSAYPIPQPTLHKLHVSSQHSTTITLSDSQHTPLEVRSYHDLGWELEVRYDLVNSEFARQIYTGAQAQLPCDELQLKTTPTHLTLTNGTEILIIDTKTGGLQFATADHSHTTLFTTPASPFAYHAQAVEIYENLMSLKVTDFSERAPFAPKGEVFSTHMVQFSYPCIEQLILGIPGQAGEWNRKGYRFQLYNTDNYLHLPNREPLYQSWPVVFHRAADGQHWMCVFHDNPSRTFIDLGDFHPDQVSFESLTGNTRVFVLFGDSLRSVSQKLAVLLGGMQLPPLWAFGYQQCRFSYMSTTEMEAVVKKMQQTEIPLDALYADIDLFDGFRVFTVNPDTFAGFSKLTQKLNQAGIHTITIMDPGVKRDPQFSVYQELKHNGGYLKNPDGSEFVAKVWPGDSVFPDFGDPHTAKWWAQKQRAWTTTYHLSGVWNDMNEPSNFAGMGKVNSRSVTARGSLAQEYNQYGYHMAKASHQGWQLAAPQTRGLIITRSGYPGVAQYAVIWHGDNHAWWEHLRLALETAVSYSICGAYYTGADVPGFIGNPSDDLAVRFFQLGAMLPFYRGHSIFCAKDKEPYAFGTETTALLRAAILLRYSLLREWYSGFERATRTHQTPLLPVFDEQSRLIRDQYLLFDKFLVAPVIQRDQTKRFVYLPAGKWYVLGDTTQMIDGNQWLGVDVELSTLPIFVRAGSIVVRNQPGRNAVETLKNTEEFEIYPDELGAATGYWYNDDGESINDEEAQRVRLEWHKGGKLKKIKI